MKRATRVSTRRTTTTKRLAGAVAAALLAFAGSAAVVGLVRVGAADWLTLLVGGALATLLRIVAMRRDWQLPAWRTEDR